MPILEFSKNLKIHFTDNNPIGSNTIILLHGLGATCESWVMQIPALVDAGYRVIAPDARGFGKSTFPRGHLSISDFVMDLNTLLQNLDIQAADMVGISMGGVVAQQFVIDHPKKVHKLVLVNTFAELKPDNLSQYFYFLLRRILVHTLGVDKQADAVANRIFPHPNQEELRHHLRNQISQADPRAYRAAMRALAKFNSLPKLREIQSPTLIVTSEKDSTVSPHRQQVLEEKIRNASRVVIPKANHAVSVEFPEQFNRILLDFLIE